MKKNKEYIEKIIHDTVSFLITYYPSDVITDEAIKNELGYLTVRVLKEVGYPNFLDLKSDSTKRLIELHNKNLK